MLPQPLTVGMGGVGEVLKTNPLLQGTTRPLKFLRTVIFLKIKQTGKQ
ncbi:terminase [Enterobacter hormaechei]